MQTFDDNQVPNVLMHVLPGGDGFPADHADGNPVLAARLSRFALTPVVRESYPDACAGHAAVTLRESTFRTRGWQATLRYHDGANGVAVALDDRPLPVADPVGFWGFIIELTQNPRTAPDCDRQGPAWGPPYLRPVLRGGRLYEADQGAKNRFLAARIARLATGPHTPGHIRMGGGVTSYTWHVPLQDGYSVIVSLSAYGRQPSIANAQDYDAFTLHRVCEGDVADSGGRSVEAWFELEEDLPIADPVTFTRLLRELTRQR